MPASSLRFALAPVLLAACAAGPTSAVAPLPDPCLVAADTAAPRRDTITVALAGGGAAERLLERQTRATDVRIDCEGRRAPGAPAAFRRVGELSPARGPADRVLLLVPAAGAGPVVRVAVLRAGADPRDALDAAPAGSLEGPADVLVTADPATLAYARRRTEFTITPLPWDRTYVLVAADAAALPPELAAGGGDLRRALARDAVRREARGAEPPFWWERGEACGTEAAGGGALPSARTRRIVYPADDATARELADRIVALAGGAATSAVPLAPPALARALAAGGETAYVVPLPRLRPASCASVPALPRGATLVPLVETRAHAVVRRGVPPFAVDGDGTIRFLPRTAE